MTKGGEGRREGPEKVGSDGGVVGTVSRCSSSCRGGTGIGQSRGRTSALTWYRKGCHPRSRGEEGRGGLRPVPPGLHEFPGGDGVSRGTPVQWVGARDDGRERVGPPIPEGVIRTDISPWTGERGSPCLSQSFDLTGSDETRVDVCSRLERCRCPEFWVGRVGYGGRRL